MSDVHTFVRAVLRSGLLTGEQLRERLRVLPREPEPTAEAAADVLVRAGALSRFQARKLLQGYTRGLILDSYEILAPIGKGGMSTIYLARDRRDTQRQQLVALKTLRPKRAHQGEPFIARFHREMELSSRLEHPHIAHTLDAGVCLGVHYLAMEFIAGQSLYRLVVNKGPLPVPRAALLFRQVAEALEHAHGRGLIHRDLKPSNIMVTPDDQAKVLDFGLALVKGEQEQLEVIGGRGYTVGTMDYIPPEQAVDASRVDERSDLYALGCSLYFALTSRPPFPGGTKLEKIRRHRKAEPMPIEALAPDVPSAFAAIVYQLMAKKPEDRYPSARAVQEVLGPWVEPPHQPARGIRASS